jgi:hypothetical protein
MAQGRVNFANTSATGIRISANGDGSASVLLGTASTAAFGIGPASTRIQLFASANSATLGDANTTFSQFAALSLTPVLIGTGQTQQVTNSVSTSATFQGTFAGGNPLSITGNSGTPLFFRFTAQSINGAYAGLSTIIQVTPSLSPAVPAPMFSVVAGSVSAWNGVTMVPVPEPSSMALAGLGAASLLIFRRRN